MKRGATQSASQDICDRAHTQLGPVLPWLLRSSLPHEGIDLLKAPQVEKGTPLFTLQLPLLPPPYAKCFFSQVVLIILGREERLRLYQRAVKLVDFGL